MGGPLSPERGRFLYSMGTRGPHPPRAGPPLSPTPLRCSTVPNRDGLRALSRRDRARGGLVVLGAAASSLSRHIDRHAPKGDQVRLRYARPSPDALLAAPTVRRCAPTHSTAGGARDGTALLSPFTPHPRREGAAGARVFIIKRQCRSTTFASSTGAASPCRASVCTTAVPPATP